MPERGRYSDTTSSLVQQQWRDHALSEMHGFVMKILGCGSRKWMETESLHFVDCRVPVHIASLGVGALRSHMNGSKADGERHQKFETLS